MARKTVFVTVMLLTLVLSLAIKQSDPSISLIQVDIISAIKDLNDTHEIYNYERYSGSLVIEISFRVQSFLSIIKVHSFQIYAYFHPSTNTQISFLYASYQFNRSVISSIHKIHVQLNFSKEMTILAYNHGWFEIIIELSSNSELVAHSSDQFWWKSPFLKSIAGGVGHTPHSKK